MRYKNQWYRNWFFALLLYVRDNIVFKLLVNRMPGFLLRLLYGGSFDFIFLIHPRRSQDYFVTVPLLSVFRRSNNKDRFLKIMKTLSPCIVSQVRTKDNLKGLVISTPKMPHDLMKYPKAAKREAERIIDFAGKILKGRRVVGLGAWWPIVTARGRSLSDSAERNKCVLTTGHMVTILSLVWTIEKILRISSIQIEKVKVVVVGGGKIGEQVCEALLSRRVRNLTIVDVSESNLLLLCSRLRERFPHVNIKAHINDSSLINVFNQHHIAVCAASSTKRFINEADIPENFIIIDDSRPEAVTRISRNPTKIVLEGGGIKFPGIKSDYDYGMGIDDNVFGCLGETILLSMDRDCKLCPTIGDFDVKNLEEYIFFCKSNGVEVGDFKMGSRLIDKEIIKEIMTERDEFLSN